MSSAPSSLSSAALAIEKLGTHEKVSRGCLAMGMYLSTCHPPLLRLWQRAACIAAASRYFVELSGSAGPTALAALPGLGLSIPEPDVAHNSGSVLSTLSVLQSLLSSIVSAKTLSSDDVTSVRSLLSDPCRRWALRIPRSVLASSSASALDAGVGEALVHVGRFQRCCYGLVWGAAERAPGPAETLQVRRRLSACLLTS